MALDVPPACRAGLADPRVPAVRDRGGAQGRCRGVGRAVLRRAARGLELPRHERDGRLDRPRRLGVDRAAGPGRAHRLRLGRDDQARRPRGARHASRRSSRAAAPASCSSTCRPPRAAPRSASTTSSRPATRATSCSRWPRRSCAPPREPTRRMVRPTARRQRGLVWERPTANGPVVVPLTNYRARIVAQLVEDDGAEQRRLFEIEGALGARTPRFAAPGGCLRGDELADRASRRDRRHVSRHGHPRPRPGRHPDALGRGARADGLRPHRLARGRRRLGLPPRRRGDRVRRSGRGRRDPPRGRARPLRPSRATRWATRSGTRSARACASWTWRPTG